MFHEPEAKEIEVFNCQQSRTEEGSMRRNYLLGALSTKSHTVLLTRNNIIYLIALSNIKPRSIHMLLWKCLTVIIVIRLHAPSASYSHYCQDAFKRTNRKGKLFRKVFLVPSYHHHFPFLLCRIGILKELRLKIQTYNFTIFMHVCEAYISS